MVPEREACCTGCGQGLSVLTWTEGDVLCYIVLEFLGFDLFFKLQFCCCSSHLGPTAHQPICGEKLCLVWQRHVCQVFKSCIHLWCPVRLSAAPEQLLWHSACHKCTAHGRGLFAAHVRNNITYGCECSLCDRYAFPHDQPNIWACTDFTRHLST